MRHLSTVHCFTLLLPEVSINALSELRVLDISLCVSVDSLKLLRGQYGIRGLMRIEEGDSEDEEEDDDDVVSEVSEETEVTSTTISEDEHEGEQLAS